MKRSSLSVGVAYGISIIVGGVAGFGFANPVYAQEGAATDPEATSTSTSHDRSITRLDEVVVTARRKSENLRDVPVAVVPISAETLDKNLITDLTTIGEVAPQVVIGRGVNGTGAQITIRGISSTQADAGVDQSVSTVVDGVPISRGRIVSTSLFDLQQVEVLQGPQALFFGKNSPAGVISLTSAKPTEYVEGQVRIGYEFEANERYLDAHFNAPLSETLALRIAVRGSSMDGWLENVAEPVENPFQPGVPMPGAWDKKLPAGENVGARMNLSWRPSDSFDAVLGIMLHQERLNHNAGSAEAFCVGDTTQHTQLGVPMPWTDCHKDMRISQSAMPAEFAVNNPLANGGVPFSKSDYSFGSLNLNWYGDNYSVSSISGYYDQTIAGAHGADFSPFTQIFNADRESYRLLTQELRFNSEFDGPFNFMAGVFGEKSDRAWRGAANVMHAYNPERQNYTTAEPRSDNDNSSYSVFAQGRWAFTPTLELSAGARYSKDKKESRIVNESVNLNSGTGPTLLPQGQVIVANIDDSNVSPEVALTWKPTANQTLYGAFKTGYKAGGVANSVFVPNSADSDNVKFGNEEVDGFEIGYRADLLDRRLRVDLTAYDYDYEGLQVTTYDVNLFRFRVLNAASASTTGLSGSFLWLATDQLSLNGNFGYNRGKYESFTGAQCYNGQTLDQGCVNGSQDLSGKAMNRAPKLTGSVGFDYWFALGNGWTTEFSASAAYSSSYQVAPDFDPAGLQDSFWRVNAGVSLNSPEERFKLSLLGRNLNNAYYMVYGMAHAGTGNRDQYLGMFNRPREIVLEATYRF